MSSMEQDLSPGSTQVESRGADQLSLAKTAPPSLEIAYFTAYRNYAGNFRELSSSVS